MEAKSPQAEQPGFHFDSNTVLAGGIIMILSVMILPLPAFLLDVFLVMNITCALIILFVTLYIMRPVDFSVFPGLLLLLTLFRLSLNIASTRLILGDGYSGEIIDAFGQFVVGGNYVVGMVVFLILVIINFVVITKGATRIAEVSARFTLDAMPGKQMAIDADLNAGLIDDLEARERREQIAMEADFYGSMDGASKFVRGDAIAGVLITAVNLIGGLLIGVLQKGLPIVEAASTFTLLTIGDGLVAQIPALLISTASGIVISRASSVSKLGTDIRMQLTQQPRALFVTSALVGVLAFIPGLPFLPFAAMAGLLGFLGQQSKKENIRQQAALEAPEEPALEAPPEDRIEQYLHPDAFEIEIGYGLIPLVDAEQGGNLLNRISMIRKSFAIEMGMIVPPIRIRDNIQQGSNEYVFKVYGVEIARGEVMVDHYMVVNPDESMGLHGVEMMEPTFGLKAMWIPSQEKEKAELTGATVVEAPAVIATHLMETLRNNCYKLLDRQEVQRMLDHLKESHSALIDELVPNLVPLGIVQKVLKNLLKEKIPVRNLIVILETIADYAAQSKDPEILTEYVRSALSETITDMLRQENGSVIVATLSPRLEDHFTQVVRNGGAAATQNMGLPPDQVNKLFQNLAEKVEEITAHGGSPVILVSPILRRYLKKFIEPILPNLMMLSYSELNMDTEIKSVGMIEYPHAGETVSG